MNKNANIPNALTVIRIFLAIWLPFLWLSDSLNMNLLGGVVFTIGAITDFLDGSIARKYNIVTAFGKIVDPIADKLLTLGAFTTLSAVGMFPFWILIPILIREIGITLLRFYFLGKGRAVASVKSGKMKTVLQIAAIYVTFANFILQTHVDLSPTVSILFNVIMYATLLAALWQTLYSGYDFLRNNFGKNLGR